MTGVDFFTAIYRGGVDLPVRIFVGGNHPNVYRPDALSFCNLTLDDDEDFDAETFALLENFAVIVCCDEKEKARSLAKAIIPSKPRCLSVVSGDTFASWAAHRGWK